MKVVVYALSSFQQQVMTGLWKDITTKIHHKVSENWISTMLRRGSLEVPRLDYEASEDAPLIGLDAAAGDQAYAGCLRPPKCWCRLWMVCGNWRAFHEIQLSPEKPPTATAFILQASWAPTATGAPSPAPSPPSSATAPPPMIMEIQSVLASGMCGAGHAVARWPRTVFMFGAMACLFVSAAAHLLASHSRRFNRLFWQLNYAGYGELFSRYIDDLDFQFRRIEDFKPVALPKSDYGKFYSGDSSIVLQTTSPKGGAYLYNVHFWIGKDSSQDEAGTAAIKTVELDSILGVVQSSIGNSILYLLSSSSSTPKFYNMYFGQSAGGRFTRKRIADKILNKKELEFYKWEGTLSDLLQNVREKHNQVASVSPKAFCCCCSASKDTCQAMDE
ncbi:hypothetical protein ZWY2020_014206 [Hordeum vulgare]|nr:hypothetical protein ZWY2020_014206 [Hordeum vulgare]